VPGPGVVVGPEDPARDDVGALVRAHLAFARSVTDPALVYALDPDERLGPDLSFFGARRGGRLVAVGALRRIDARHAEIKTMHVAPAARGRGIGRAVLDELLHQAAARRYRRVSLETGAGEAFAPARALYAGAGFVPCAPFGDYRADPASICMTLVLPGGPGRA